MPRKIIKREVEDTEVAQNIYATFNPDDFFSSQHILPLVQALIRNTQWAGTPIQTVIASLQQIPYVLNGRYD